MAYDPGTGQLVLFGGNDGSGTVADTWIWNGSDWTELSPATSPPARSDASMAYDPGTGQLVLFGGNDGVGGFDGSTWAFSPVKASQLITFNSSAPSSAIYSGSNNQSYVVSATASSGLSVTFSIESTSASDCTISGSTVSYGGAAGTCVIDANQAGNGGYLATAQSQQSFSIAKALQSITFTSSAPSNAGVGGGTYTPTASSSSGLTVQFSLDGTSSIGSCTVLAGTVSLAGVGTCIVDADQAGNADYQAAPQVQESFTIAQGSQSITFTSSAPSSAIYGGSNNQSYVVSTTASSGLSVTLSIDPSSTSGCTISGSTVSYGGGLGTCIVDADQAGNVNYLAAPQVQENFTIGAPTPPPGGVSNPPGRCLEPAPSGVSNPPPGGVSNPPPGGYVGVSINSGDYATDSYSVQLDLVWPTGATSALVSNDGGFDTTGSTEMLSLSPALPWTLANTGFNGLPETIYVRFIGAGIDTTTFTDDIILDKTVPSISSATLVGSSGSVTPSAVATELQASATSSLHGYSVRVLASEQVSGISIVRLSSSTSGGVTVTFTSPKSKGILTLDRTVSVSMAIVPRYVRVRDGGTWSQWLAIAKATSTIVLKASVAKVTYGDEQVEHLSVTVSPRVRRLDANRDSDDQASHDDAVCHQAVGYQGVVQSVRQEAQGGHLPPRRHLQRRRELQGLDFDGGILNRYQGTMKAAGQQGPLLDRSRADPHIALSRREQEFPHAIRVETCPR